MNNPPITEQRNPRTIEIDVSDTVDILTMLNDEDALVAGAVRVILPDLARVVDEAEERYRSGGSIHYFGAGTSGRIGGLDAAELPPTFSVPDHRVTAHIAGGMEAILRSREDVEDDYELGAADAAGIDSGDIVFGMSASGTTPYVVGALTRAKAARAMCVVVSSNDDPELRRLCDHYLFVDTGPEPITGSTRMKAATAQKMILNSFSTALMVRLGMTYSNLMVDVAQTNHKLRSRAVRLLWQATGQPADVCQNHLEHSEGQVKVALLTLMGAPGPEQARAALEASQGHVRRALTILRSERPLEVP